MLKKARPGDSCHHTSSGWWVFAIQNKLALDPLVPYSFDNEEGVNCDMSNIILSQIKLNHHLKQDSGERRAFGGDHVRHQQAAHIVAHHCTGCLPSHSSMMEIPSYLYCILY